MDGTPFLEYRHTVEAIMEAAQDERGLWYISEDVVLTHDEYAVLDACWFRGVPVTECAAMLLSDRMVPAVAD